ncbi:hypothetical protein [Micromonospora sp. NBRC 101691]|uniref:hypothetical protein n=1 Tax=Micromonospora sp. NBRC 101691 TaxID=3032198 RepID=UPI0024A18A8E|nr:hypothetical protein [Micromonospora sp. NBRC 101691]GLY21927.1 hypothetical protein Misp04_16590 [Micromonospora sp. NBRC 101691]
MTPTPGLVLPAYARYYGTPVKMVETPDGGMCAWRVSIDNGGWEKANELIDEILFAREEEIFTLSPEEFVQAVERYRARYLSGQGPIFALYETVKAIVDVEERERRYLDDRERALVRGIRRKTFVMFEEQLRQQGDPGADPSVGQANS